MTTIEAVKRAYAEVMLNAAREAAARILAAERRAAALAGGMDAVRDDAVAALLRFKAISDAKVAFLCHRLCLIPTSPPLSAFGSFSSSAWIPARNGLQCYASLSNEVEIFFFEFEVEINKCATRHLVALIVFRNVLACLDWGWLSCQFVFDRWEVVQFYDIEICSYFSQVPEYLLRGIMLLLVYFDFGDSLSRGNAH
jgi:hypothetical protein